MLTSAVFLWSLSTLITPFVASNLSLLLICRVILGLGEGLGQSRLNCHLNFVKLLSLNYVVNDIHVFGLL